ncbi:MAG: C40 family peptidase [Deltaproteobacteria bacterium]|jgi:murein DD-endopeptidase|nr:C40 family peptidase [Deltaproteobacteria bacterium]
MIQLRAHPPAKVISPAFLSLFVIWSFLLAPACLSDIALFSAFADKAKPRATNVRQTKAAKAKSAQKTTLTKTTRATQNINNKSINAKTINKKTLNKKTSTSKQPPISLNKKLSPKSVSQVTPSSLDLEESLALADPVADDEDRDLINFSTVTQGLTGRLTTGTAGNEFLAKYGLLPRKASLSGDDKFAALDYDQAPRSSRFLRLSQGVTNRLLLNAYSQTGRPFEVNGRAPATGFDDPGLVQWLYAQVGVRLPTKAADQVAAGQAVAKDLLRPGDLLVYKTPKDPDYVVGVYAGNGTFILASKRHRRVTEAAAFDTEYGPYFIGGRRFLDDPKAAPLSDDLKTEATNGAVKLALAELGDNIPKPANIYGSPKKIKSKSYRKGKANKRGSKSRATVKKGAVKKTTRAKSFR